jgi:EAL and modified HD-GYP domain-containing signal transduction protein
VRAAPSGAPPAPEACRRPGGRARLVEQPARLLARLVINAVDLVEGLLDPVEQGGEHRSSGDQARTAAAPITQVMSSHPIQEQSAGGAEVAISVAVARQPIFDRSEAITGFEVLYRPMPGREDPRDPEAATSSVIAQSLADIGLERLAGNQRVHINVTREFLLKVRPLPLPSERVVLELVGDQNVDAELLVALRDAADAGFQIALDDFRLSAEHEPLLELAGAVKLDIRVLDGQSLIRHLARLRDRGLRLIAEKVETRQDYQGCRALGFDEFQGYFFAEPVLVSARTAPTHRLGALGVLVQPGQQASFEELERLITQDAGLSHKLVRLVSSAFVGPRHEVASVRQALMLLGTVAVRRWATLLVLAGLTDRPQHLLTVGLLRARLCELLATQHPLAAPDRAFTVGLFSVVDALLGRPMSTLLNELPFDSRLKHALLDHQGPEGRLLAAVLDHERGDFDDGDRHGVTLRALAQAYRHAVEWADEATRQLT